MLEWWESLTNLQQVFYAIAGVSTVILFLQLVLNLIGLAGDHDIDGAGMHADVPDGVDVDHPDLTPHSSGLGLISFRTITAFCVGFGWTGVVTLGSGLAPELSIPIAVFIGLFFVMTVFYIMKEIYKLADQGNIDFRNAIGQIGTVYVTVPAKKQGVGQVQVKVQGRLREIPAVTYGDDELATREPVKVVKLIGRGTLVVRKLEDE